MSQFTETEMAKAVLQSLIELKEDGPTVGEVGICSNVAEKLIEQDITGYLADYWETSRNAAFENWDDPLASGCTLYPIEGPYNFASTKQMWVVGEYADARWRLVDHLIEHYTSIAEGAE